MTGQAPPDNPSSLYQQIYALVRQIPVGYVTTYGRLGQLIGCTARTVGFAMASLSVDNDVPWQRVVNSQGKVSVRSVDDGHVLQVDMLQAEGVCFDSGQKIDLETFGWEFPVVNEG